MIIVLAGIVVGFQTDQRILSQPELVDTLNVLNWIILAVFTFECIVKILAEGLTPMVYFKDSWNKFDFLIVFSEFIDLVL